MTDAPTPQTHSAPVSVVDIVNARFTPLRAGDRYSMRDVDAFLSRAAATLDGKLTYPEALTFEDVDGGVMFLGPGFFREGYSAAEVDQLTTAIAETLKNIERLEGAATGR